VNWETGPKFFFFGTQVFINSYHINSNFFALFLDITELRIFPSSFLILNRKNIRFCQSSTFSHKC